MPNSLCSYRWKVQKRSATTFFSAIRAKLLPLHSTPRKNNSKTMIYIHTPFCASKCHYCDFYSVALRGVDTQNIVNTICIELKSRASELTSPPTSIYFGGGTPSLLHPTQIKEILDTIAKNFDTSSVEEITLEANPEQLTESYLHSLLSLGINRLSIGIQTFSDSRLKFIGRRHTTAEAADAVKRAQKCGFENISIDLMFGFADHTLEEWQSDIAKALELGVQHISAYQLSIEPRTLFAKRGTQCATDELCQTLFLELHNTLCQNGWQHYEISNFSLPDLHSRHNSGYWSGKPYLGVGASAHSFDGNRCRSWNVSSVKDYIEGVELEKEYLSNTDLHNEYLMTRLRTAAGFMLDDYKKKFGRDFKATTRGLNIENGRVFIEAKNLFTSDDIISTLFEIG